MQRSACERFGCNEETRAQRLRWLGLTDKHHATVALLQEMVIRPNIASIVNAFYGTITKEREFWKIVRTRMEFNSLKRRHGQYLCTLGVDFDTEGYFETRLRVGIAHARAGVPLWLYHAAFSSLLHGIHAHIPRGPDTERLVDVTCRIVSLDQALATEIYHSERMRDATQELRSAEGREAAQRTRASRDSLTGLVRRDEAVDALARAVERTRGHGQHLSVIMADLDHFKDINDEYGHLAGDAVLRGFGERVEKMVRDGDVVGRYGGEEFLIILDNTPLERAREIAERIRDSIAEAPFAGQGSVFPVTVSQGIAELAVDETPIDVLSRADVALYRAKSDGRNCVRLARPPMKNTA